MPDTHALLVIFSMKKTTKEEIHANAEVGNALREEVLLGLCPEELSSHVSV